MDMDMVKIDCESGTVFLRLEFEELNALNRLFPFQKNGKMEIVKSDTGMASLRLEFQEIIALNWLLEMTFRRPGLSEEPGFVKLAKQFSVLTNKISNDLDSNR